MSKDDSWSEETRTALASGNLSLANRLSGKWYSISGRVVHGDHLGRQLGFPTANLELPKPAEFLLPFGVYAAQCLVNETVHQCIVNVGIRPTIGGKSMRIEAHLFDFSGDIYGAMLQVEFVARIRDEKKFNGLDELITQIGEDIRVARMLLS